MAEVKWVKLTVDMFDNRKIKYLRSLPDGNSIVLIWVMLLTIAGRCNAGGMIFLTENVPYTPEMLANELDFEVATVKLALTALENLGMVVTNQSGSFAITGWEEHQNVDGMEKIREQNRLRKKKQRENQKLLSRDCHGTGNDTVTQCHATDIDKDLDIDALSKKSSKSIESSSTVGIKVVDAALSEICQDFEANIGSISPAEYDLLRNWALAYDKDLVITTIHAAAIRKKKSGRYIDATLRKCVAEGVQTAADFKARMDAYELQNAATGQARPRRESASEKAERESRERDEQFRRVYAQEMERRMKNDHTGSV